MSQFGTIIPVSTYPGKKKEKSNKQVVADIEHKHKIQRLLKEHEKQSKKKDKNKSS